MIGRYVPQWRLREGQRFPRGWGFAWYLPETAEAFILPIPLNWIAGICRRAWIFLARGVSDPLADAARTADARGYARGFDRGFEAGKSAGLIEGKDAAFKLLDDMIEKRNTYAS